jgi:hypothetical protein
MKVETQWLIDKLYKQCNEASNSYERNYYSNQIKNLEDGKCPYGCIDYKKMYQEDKKLFLGRKNKVSIKSNKNK